MLTAVIAYAAPAAALGALVAAVMRWQGRRPAAPAPGFAAAAAEIRLRARAAEGRDGADAAARVVAALAADRTDPTRAVTAAEIRAGLMDPAPARARLGAQGTPTAYRHARTLADFEHQPGRGRITALAEQVLTGTEENPMEGERK